jgi:hypothetical protein
MVLMQADVEDIERVLAAVSRPSDDATVPFQCENCEYDFDDFPALIVIEADPERLYYCTDECAEMAGWTDAVVRRWAHVVANEAESIIFVPARSMAA